MGDSWSFLAQYDGTCGRCEESVKGQRVKYVDGELVHTGCADGEGVLTVTRKEVVCEECFIVKPCGCEEEQK
ncbi:MAG: hypothetical protein WED09_07340 [Homoserinimonas sp.]